MLLFQIYLMFYFLANLISILDISSPGFQIKRRKSIKPVNFELGSEDLLYLIQNYSDSKMRKGGLKRVARKVISKRDSLMNTDEEVPSIKPTGVKSKFSKET